MRVLHKFLYRDVFAYTKVVTESNKCMPRLQCEIRGEADGETIIDIHEVIGDSWAEMSSADLVPKIRDIKTPIRLSVDTPGGSVFDAVAIYQTLVQHPHRVEADIVGMNASAGTIVTAAADKIRIAKAGTFMLHRAWSFVVGNSAEMRAAADVLDKIDEELDDVLALRTGLTAEEIRELSIGPDGADGTWLTGQEAVEKGFADELLPTKSKPDPENKAAKVTQPDVVQRYRSALWDRISAAVKAKARS